MRFVGEDYFSREFRKKLDGLSFGELVELVGNGAAFGVVRRKEELDRELFEFG
jgi:hypothetical protein